MGFLKKNSYTIVKLFINQLAISIFGNVLAIACGMADNQALKLVTSIFAILFFLFLNYSVLWEIGYKNIPAIDAGRMPRRPLNGFYMALWASVPNFIFAVIIMLAQLFCDIEFFSTLGGVTSMIAIWVQGMYTGLLSYIKINAQPANAYWISYFLITIPGLLAGLFGYWFGILNLHLTRINIAETPEEAEKKRNAKLDK